MSDSEAMKIGMFGGGGVGKTCITLRYLKGEFSDGYIPTIEDEFSKTIEVDGKTVSLTVIDTAGQDDFAEMRYSYFKSVKGFVFVFDISNPQSIEDLRNIYKDAEDAVDDEIVCVIAANKADLRGDSNKTDLVPEDEYKKLEDEFHCKVIETSAKVNKGIDELFLAIIREKLKPKGSSSPEAKKTEKSSGSKKEKEGGEGGCCNIA